MFFFFFFFFFLILGTHVMAMLKGELNGEIAQRPEWDQTFEDKTIVTLLLVREMNEY